MHSISMILVPIDFSPHSSVALQYAIDFARRYNAALELVHVFDIGIYSLGDGSPMLDPAQFENIVNQIEHDLDEAKRDALAAGVGDVQTKLLQGKPDQRVAAHCARRYRRSGRHGYARSYRISPSAHGVCRGTFGQACSLPRLHSQVDRSE